MSFIGRSVTFSSLDWRAFLAVGDIQLGMLDIMVTGSGCSSTDVFTVFTLVKSLCIFKEENDWSVACILFLSADSFDVEIPVALEITDNRVELSSSSETSIVDTSCAVLPCDFCPWEVSEVVFDPDTTCVSDVAPLMDFATDVFLEIPEEEDSL